MVRAGEAADEQTGEIINLWFESLVGYVGGAKDQMWARIQEGHWHNPDQAVQAMKVYAHLDKALTILQTNLRQLSFPETE